MPRRMEAVQRARELDPLSLVGRNNLAVMLAASGLIDEARRQYRAARDLAPGQAGAFDQQLARLLIMEGRHEAVLELLRDTPPGRVYDATVAIALDALGRAQEAAAAAAVLRLQADVGGETAMLLAEVYAQRGDFDTAFHWLALSQAGVVGTLLKPRVGDITQKPFRGHC
ncbi:MAG: hypothetical protein ACNA8G_09240 [Gammaproteobacteria bacterium]